MTYLASGMEPKEILAFSRTGLPMIARQGDLGTGDFSLRYFTEETVDHLIKKHDGLDFKLHLLPFIQHEFRYQYVVHLLLNKSDKSILSEKTLLELEFFRTGIFPEFSPFDLEKFLSPKLPAKELHSAVIAYLEETVYPENFDELHQSFVAMSALWREINPIFNKLYSFGKLSGESQRCFDLNYYSRFQHVAYGPPQENMEKILALAKDGMLRFDLATNPKVSIQPQSSKVKIKNKQVPCSKVASLLIDARIPKSGGLETQPEYIRQLILEMGVDFFSNDDYKTGCLEIDGTGRLEHLIQRNIELRIEPGRSLLDQAGITIAKVAFRKKDSQGRLLIGLEMNRTQMFSSSADFLLDPVFLPQNSGEDIPCEVYFVGAYCLEQELILKRKIALSQHPQVGDLVCFVNTAGYMMHFYESEAHLFDLAQNLITEKRDTWEAIPDELDKL